MTQNNKICIVAAVAENGVIGAQGALPWRLPEDLRHFKLLTTGHTVIMGRRTWESIGERPLPGRNNIVVSRSLSPAVAGARVARSLEAALELCAEQPVVYVIGGARLYAAALPIADELVLTEIHKAYAGDTRFPDFDRGAWRERRRDAHTAQDGTAFDIVVYVRAAGAPEEARSSDAR